MNLRNINLTQSVLHLDLQYQRINDICILKNSELLERLCSLECGVGSRHGKSHKILKLYIRGLQGQGVCVLAAVRCDVRCVGVAVLVRVLALCLV